MLAQTIAMQTLNSENYEGEITLSSKDSYSDLWGGTLPNIVGWSTAGVYIDVRLETDKHLFRGSLQLAPPGIDKTTWFGLVNVPISLNYAQQKGGYIVYSDFDDPRIASYFSLVDSTNMEKIFNTGTNLIEEPLTILDPDAVFMTTSILFLENTISLQTNGEYDTIYPYMMYTMGAFIPTFQFAGLNSKLPIPEYYHEYPIFVEDQYFPQLQEFCSTIYKVFDSDSSQEIELIPEDGAHKIYGDIDHIDAYLVNSLGEKFSPHKINKDHYSYDNKTGILTLSDTKFEDLQLILDLSKEVHESIENYDVYYIFEVKVEKFRPIDPTSSIDSHIATMQAIEQTILEYTYQYTHAQATQQGLSEMFYTFLITSISTIITIGLTIGPASGTSLSVSLALSPITESLQEIFVDPYLETIITDIVAKAGGNVFWQILISSLVEGGREAMTGPMSSLLLMGVSQMSQSVINSQKVGTNLYSAQATIKNAITQKETFNQVKPQWSSIIKTGASLILGAALIGIGGPMFFGASLACGFMAIQSISDSYKIEKQIVEDLVDQKSVLGVIHEGMHDTAENIQKLVDEEKITQISEQAQPIISDRMAVDTFDLYHTSPVSSFMRGPHIFASHEYNDNTVRPELGRREDKKGSIESILGKYASYVGFVKDVKLLLPELKALNFDLKYIVEMLDSGVSSPKVTEFLTNYVAESFMAKLHRNFNPNMKMLKDIMKIGPIGLDFTFIDTKILEANNPFEKFYFQICRELIKAYSDPHVKLTPYVKSVFGELLKLKDGDRPLSGTTISQLIGMEKSYINELLQRTATKTGKRPNIRFKSFATKIEPSLARAFGQQVADDIISEFLLGHGYRLKLLYSFYKVLLSKTNKHYSLSQFSEILLKKVDKASVFSRRADPKIRDLHELWKLEHLVLSLKPNKNLGFDNNVIDNDGNRISNIDKIIQDIQIESVKLIRAEVIRQVPGSINPVAFIMIYESLRALSSPNNLIDFAKLSKRLHVGKYYISQHISSLGKNPSSLFARNLLKLLAREGLSSNDMAVQWTEYYLETRGLAYLNFDFFMKELTMTTRITTGKTTLTPTQIRMSKTIVWGMTGGRSWLTGEKIDLDDVWLHHIRHDQNGYTLYGGIYDSLGGRNFAALTEDQNHEVEIAGEKEADQDLFIHMWDLFMEGDFKAATDHWNQENPQFQIDFLRERRSKRYIDNWLINIQIS